MARRPHWSTLLGAGTAALLALVTLGPVVVAVLMLRCCSDSTGPTPGAWVLLTGLLGAVLAVAALLGGILVAGARRLTRRLRR